MREALRQIATAWRGSRHVVAFTGAGMSAQSGVPTYRDADGLWTRLGGGSGSRLSEAIAGVARCLAQARPHEGHRALAHLEATGLLEAVVTQNIDGLHQEAGQREVVELHGSALRLRCAGCATPHPVPRPMLESLGAPPPAGERDELRAYLERLLPPCDRCGRRMRPDVVLFGEPVPSDAWNRAVRLCSSCDLLLVVGTSALVAPAADLPLLARSAGATVVEVNPVPSAIGLLATHHVRAPARESLVDLAALLGVAGEPKTQPS